MSEPFTSMPGMHRPSRRTLQVDVWRREGGGGAAHAVQQVLPSVAAWQSQRQLAARQHNGFSAVRWPNRMRALGVRLGQPPQCTSPASELLRSCQLQSNLVACTAPHLNPASIIDRALQGGNITRGWVSGLLRIQSTCACCQDSIQQGFRSPGGVSHRVCPVADLHRQQQQCR